MMQRSNEYTYEKAFAFNEIDRSPLWKYIFTRYETKTFLKYFFSKCHKRKYTINRFNELLRNAFTLKHGFNF